MKIIYILLGGALGTLGRYLVSGFAHKIYLGLFPLGTLLVNLIGSFIIGLCWGLFEQNNFAPNLRTFIFIGILGGFTTFSSFSLETMNLFRDGEIRIGIFNILANNLLGLLLVFGGLFTSRELLVLLK